MANQYYGRTFAFADGTKASGSEVKSELDSIASGMDSVDTDIARSIKMPSGTQELPAIAADRSLTVIGFDSSGNMEVQSGVGAFKGDWAVGQTYKVRDIIIDAAGAVKLDSVYIVSASHTSVDLAADIANFDIMIDLTKVKTSETNAAASEVQTGLDAVATASDRVQTGLDATATAADRVQTGLDAVATAADVVTTNSNASSASTSATNAGNSASAASTSESNTQSLFDSFDTRYLGWKGSAPTLDNQGNALIDGAMYFDTTLNIIRVYDLGGTTWVNLPATTASGVINVPSGNITATQLQAAINELDTEKEPADSTILKDADIGATVQAFDADLNTVASNGIGTGANQIVQLDGAAKLPAIDGSQLTGMTFGSRTINTPTRAIATTYSATNSDIFISIEMVSTGGQSIYELLVDGVSRYKSSQAVGVGGTMVLNAVVPKGSTYKLQAVFSTASLNTWIEYQ